MSRALILAGHDGRAVSPATLNVVAAGKELGARIVVLIAGRDCRAAAEHAARIDGVSEVLLAEGDVYADAQAESLAALALANAGGASHILAAADTFGKNVAPRLGALLDVQPVSDVIAILAVDVFKRPIYAGNAIATVRSTDAIKVLTIRPTAFPPAAATQTPAPIVPAAMGAPVLGARLVSRTAVHDGRPELTTAKTVVAGGRGVGSADGFALIEALADALNGAVGATRAAVDAGFAPNDRQIGQTGKTVAPRLYVAVGLSGAIQHLAGMKDSEIIVAINTDEDAPILKVADFGLVADLRDAVPALTAAIKARKR